mgnify:CR=1 FL=1
MKLYTILITREISKYEKVEAENIDEACKKATKNLESLEVIAPKGFKFDAQYGMYNMSKNKDGDEIK